MHADCSYLFLAVLLWATPCCRAAVSPSSSAELTFLSSSAGLELENGLRNSSRAAGSRRKRYVSSRDMAALLEYHNRVRSQVFPPAANMEYMVWDERLAKSAESWASQCIWDHGPSHVMKYMGQNLSISSGSTNRIGCAINRCSNMYVFGSTWKQATLLVCNYSIKGNWVGEAPYKTGKPCSACPSVYGGSCNKNQCSTSKRRRNWF
uniref:R3H domain containing-like n=1 Tax=Astyanax mexicanus TaxID=7994 RepID=A0A8B9HWL2_ASTMX